MHFHSWVKFVFHEEKKQVTRNLKKINDTDHYNTIAPQTDFGKKIPLGFSIVLQHSTVITEQNLLLKRKRYKFLYQQRSTGDGKSLGNIGNHKLKPQ